jgi:DNA-binding transcriptional ArsR family regulator
MSVKRNPSKRTRPMPDSQVQAVARLFATLAEPTRLRILRFLEAGPASVNQIMAAVGLKQANTSRQLGILYTAGVLDRGKDKNLVRYRIRMPVVFDLCHLVCHRLKQEVLATAKALD